MTRRPPCLLLHPPLLLRLCTLYGHNRTAAVHAVLRCGLCDNPAMDTLCYVYIYGYGYVPLFYVVFPVLSFRIFMSQSSPLEVNVERHVQYLNWPPACLPARLLRHLSVGDCDCGATGTGKTGAGAGAGSVAEAGHGLLAPVANRQRRSNVRERERQLATKCWRRLGVECVASEAAKILVSSVSNCLNLDGSHSQSHSWCCCCTLVASQKVKPNPQLGHKIQY